MLQEEGGVPHLGAKSRVVVVPAEHSGVGPQSLDMFASGLDLYIRFDVGIFASLSKLNVETFIERRRVRCLVGELSILELGPRA